MAALMCRQLDECPSSYQCMCNVIEDRDRYKAALEKIMNIRTQDKQIVDAWKEARQIAFDAF